MKQSAIGRFLALASAAFLLALAPTAAAVTPPAVSLSDDAGNTIIVDGNAVVTYGGSCTPATCTTSSVSVSSGQTDWVGSIGSFSLRALVGTTKPYSVPNPSQDLNLQHVTSTTGGTLTVSWTDTNFNYSDISGATIAAGGVLTGSGSSTYTAYFDNTNVPFGTGIPVGTLGPFSTSGSFSGSINGPGPTASPFSMTETVTLTLGPGAVFGVDFEFIPLPAPLQLNCSANAGQVGVPYSSSLMALGGIPPYTYSIPSGMLPPGLTLNTSTGAITGIPTAVGTYSFTAQVVDSSEGSADTVTSTCSIIVTQPPPISLSCPITTGQVNVPYTSALAASGGVPAYTYSIKSGVLPNGLTLNPSTGAITGTPTTAGAFTFIAQVQDSTNSLAGTTTSNCSITINSPPTATCPTVTTGEVGVPFNSSMSPSGGAGPPYTFSNATNLPPGLSIDSNGVVSGTPTTAGTYTFTVTVKDANGIAATVSCTIVINGPPILTCSASGTSGEVGVPFNSPALTVSGGTAPFTFSVVGTLPAGLTLNTSTGGITGTPTAAGTFSIQVKDANGVVSTTTCPYTIVAPPSLTCSAINSGEVGVPFNSPAVTVTGGTAPFTFAVVGTLPAGLTLNSSTGAISGTPTAPGTFSIQVTDANGVTASGTCPYTIVAAPVLTCSAINSGEVGVPFNSPAMTVTGGTAPYTFSVVGTLPAGLTLNTSTGAISGTATAAGTFSIQVKDTNGATATGACAFTIVGPPVVTCSTVNTGEVGVPFNSPAMTVTGGTAPYTFSVVGTLPAGLTLNTSTGAITGTPTAAGTFSIQVKDANGATATGTCAFTIVGPPVVTCSAVNSGEVGVPFNSPAMTVTGGTAPYTFSVVGTLPAGLTLNTSTGAISGTPTAAGTFSIQVKDTNGATATGTCAFTIVGPPVVTCSTVNTGEVGVPFNSPAMTVTGGTAPYTFSVVGTLPAGLTLNTSTGAISGTPTAAGTFSIQVKDTNGATATGACAFTIVGPPVVTCSAVNSGEVGVPFNSPAMTVTGGTAPYTFSVVGTLPAGLTLNTSTGAITGTPTAAGTFSIQVKDTNGATATGACAFTIVGPPVVTCSAVNSGEVGVPFNSPAMTVTGGTAPYTFSVVGTLPAGLTLNTSTGAITGTPTAAGTFSIQVKDANGATATGACAFTIVGPPVVTCSAVNSGQVGVPFNSPAMMVTGGTAPYTFSVVGTLPAGLTLNTSTGAISGTPTVAGTFSIQVKDANGATATGACAFTIVGPPVVTCSAVNSGEVGVPFNSPAMTVTGGTAPYTFSVVGTLPAGLTLNTSTGAITGTPTAAGTFSIQVKDANGATATGVCAFTIVGPPVVTCSAVNSGQVGVPFNSPAMMVTGGTAPYTFSVVGTLPAGLTLNTSTGAISGTPTVAGTFSIQVKDANGATATGACAFTIIAITPLTLTCPTSAAQLNSPYSSAAVASGGVPPYTFSVASGTLPPGLTLNASTGAITGTPTTSGTFGFTIMVKDSTGATALSNCSSSCNAAASWNFNVPSGPLGASQAYTANGITITAYGFAIGGSPAALYGKNDSGDENGLGIYGQQDNEITTSHFVQLDLTNVIASGAQNAQILINSVQSGDGYIIYGSNTLGTLGTQLTSGSLDNTPFAIPNYPNYKYITVIASSGNVLVGSVSVTITNCNIVVSTPVDLECGSCGGNKATVGVSYSSRLSATGGVGPYTFSVISGSLPPGLTLNTSTGVISGTPTTPGTYTFTSKATDSNGNTDTATCTIVVQPVPIDLQCGSCGGGKPTVGTPYSSQLSVTGGTGPFTFSIISGSLPPGLTLNSSTGAITGTPTTPGMYTFTSKVVDSEGSSDTATCTIVVVASPVNLGCGSCGAGKATTGAAYSAQLSATGGTAPYTYSIISGSLPPGLTLNASTGVISGTPTTAGTYTFTSKVVDANGYTDTQTCTIVVTAPPINLDCGTCGSGNAKVGSPYSATYAVTGGKAPFTFSIISGSLPPGLSLNSSTGKISGTPTTAGTYTFTAKVVDANGSYDTQACTIVVGGTYINLNCGTCGASNATVGVSYSAQYSVVGGIGPFTYSILSGSLPAGLTLNSSTGVISGKPTTPGSYTFTAKVVDSRGNSDTQACTITVTAAPIDLECGSCGSGNGTAGTAYSSQLSVTGGSGPFTYSIVSGSLPSGLTLNSSTGVISGTPTTAGSFTFTSKVVDSKGTSDTTTCTIVVVAPVIDLQCGSCGTGRATVGSAYSSTLTVVGGTAPFTFSILSGSLPPGVTLNASTGAISGTPTTAGNYTFTSKVVDAKGKSDTTTCTIMVQAQPINLDCGPCSASKAWSGQSYSATMIATGGTGHYTYSIVSGSLPAGLTLNSSTGTISGTPTTPGTYTFTSKVVDSSGNSDTDTCTIVVQGSPVNLACGSCGAGNAYQGQGYASTLKTTGGTGQYTYSIISGSLPAGLTLNTSTGVISGTPTKAGTYTFTSKVVDSNGNSDTTTCTINVEQSYCNWSWN